MKIDIIREKFNVSVYDKRDSFGFEVLRYPSIHSNIPDKTLYNLFYSQLVRFSRVCNIMEDFISACILLKGRVLSKGGKEIKLFTTFKKFWANNDIKYISWKDAVLNIFGVYYLG